MRCLIYKDTLENGRGADRAVKNFAAALAERGHAVRLIEKPQLAVALGESFDVIVATGSNEAVDLDRLGYFDRPDRARTVLQLHLAPRGFFKWKHPIRNWRIRRAFDKFDAVQLLCHSYVEEFRCLAPHPQLVVIGNWTNFSTIEQSNNRTVEQPPVILYPAAIFSNTKNQQLLIRAFACLVAEFPSWKLRLLGKYATPVAAVCRKLVDRLGLSGKVEIVGFTDDLAGEYERAAFIAFPSTLEGFPLAILEAARYGLPVVAIKSLPGVADIVKDGETGLVVDGTPVAFAAGLRQLMTNESLRHRMGERARAYCIEHYSREKVLDQWETLLKAHAGRAIDVGA